ncbi:MAG: LysR family transcriptional regulator [Telluria sp.]
MDQVKSMHIFRAVAECKSFAQAAEQLDLPRPTVTNAVQLLERSLGVRLLQRTTRRVSLTVEGELYLERCSRILEDIEDMNGLFNQTGAKPSGVVRVDMPERLARKNLIPKLPDFFQRYPEIQLRVGATDRFTNLVGEGIDCAIRVGTLRDSSLVAKRIGQMEQVNLAAPAYLQQHGTPETLSDLPHHFAVNFFSTQTGRDLDWEYVEAGETHTVPMRSLVAVASSEAYLACCKAGLGMIQAPRLSNEAALAAGELVEVLPRWRPAPLPVSVVYSHNRQLSPRVKAFVDWVAAVLQVH